MAKMTIDFNGGGPSDAIADRRVKVAMGSRLARTGFVWG